MLFACSNSIGRLNKIKDFLNTREDEQSSLNAEILIRENSPFIYFPL